MPSDTTTESVWPPDEYAIVTAGPVVPKSATVNVALLSVADMDDIAYVVDVSAVLWTDQPERAGLTNGTLLSNVTSIDVADTAFADDIDGKTMLVEPTTKALLDMSCTSPFDEYATVTTGEVGSVATVKVAVVPDTDTADTEYVLDVLDVSYTDHPAVVVPVTVSLNCTDIDVCESTEAWIICGAVVSSVTEMAVSPRL